MESSNSNKKLLEASNAHHCSIAYNGTMERSKIMILCVPVIAFVLPFNTSFIFYFMGFYNAGGVI
jgi:hypothetical protein